MLRDTYPIIVFYDGACRMCVGQMEKFKKRNAAGRLGFVDISRPDFDAKKFGLENEPLLKYIYAKDQSGHVVRGVDAFIVMWRATGNNFLAALVGLPLVKQLGKLLYKIIARSRYIFGKKANVCDFHCAKEM